jgi:hypothetical protein
MVKKNFYREQGRRKFPIDYWAQYIQDIVAEEITVETAAYAVLYLD